MHCSPCDLSDITPVLLHCPELNWSPTLLKETLDTPHTHLLGLFHQKTGLGFLVYRTLIDEAEFLLIAIDPTRRRQGLGTFLLEYCCNQLTKQGISHSFLEVRASHHAAQALYQKLGFKPIARRPAYYTHPSEDALVLKRLHTFSTRLPKQPLGELF